MGELQDLTNHFTENPKSAQAVLSQAPAEEAPRLLLNVEHFIEKYVILPNWSSLPISLWVVATHIFEVFDTFPYLAILSPLKRSGKTRLMEVIEVLCRVARRITSPSEAVLFRLIHQRKPTLLLDEMETLKQRNSERAIWINALLNAGHRRGAVIPRCEKNTLNLQEFSVYCPKALAAIGRIPDTISDRSLVISMQRRKPSESVGRFLFGRVRKEAEPILSSMARLLESSREEIARVYEESPSLLFLEDRDEECWAPLFAICAVLDSARLEELKQAAIHLTKAKASDDADDSLQLRLLNDIRDVWGNAEGKVFTRDLLDRLRGVEDGPWSEECPMTPRKLARRLRQFKVLPREVRIADIHGKGYVRDELEAAWLRYLQPEARQARQSA